MVRRLLSILIIMSIALLTLPLFVATSIQAFRFLPDTQSDKYEDLKIDDNTLFFNPGLRNVLVLADMRDIHARTAPPVVSVTPYEALITLASIHFQEGQNMRPIDIFLAYSTDIVYDEKHYRVVLYVDAPTIHILLYSLLIIGTAAMLIIILHFSLRTDCTIERSSNSPRWQRNALKASIKTVKL